MAPWVDARNVRLLPDHFLLHYKWPLAAGRVTCSGGKSCGTTMQSRSGGQARAGRRRHAHLQLAHCQATGSTNQETQPPIRVTNFKQALIAEPKGVAPAK